MLSSTSSSFKDLALEVVVATFAIFVVFAVFVFANDDELVVGGAAVGFVFFVSLFVLLSLLSLLLVVLLLLFLLSRNC